MLKSTLFGVLIALAFINVAVAQKSLVVVTSNKFDRPVLDADRLRDHSQNNEVTSYLVDSSSFQEDTISIAKKLLQTAGVKPENVNSFVMEAHEVEESVKPALAKVQELSVEDLAKVLTDRPQSIIYFTNKARSHSRILEQTSEPSSANSKLFTNMTPNVLSGLFVAIFLIVMLLIGVSCLVDIKTNDKFASTNLFVGKES